MTYDCTSATAKQLEGDLNIMYNSYYQSTSYTAQVKLITGD